MNHRVDKSEVDRLRAVIEQAPERAARVSRGKALRMLAPQLRALRGRGYTVDDIVELLEGGVSRPWARAGVGSGGGRPR